LGCRHTRSDGAALSRGETVSRRPLHPSGAFHGGISPGRFRGVWLHRSPPRLSAHHLSACTGALEALTTRMRHTRMRAHATLLTLTPAFPSRPDPCGPAFEAGLPLLGLSKDRPSIELRRRVRRPGIRVSAAPSGNDSRSLPRSALVVSHHLGGFLLSDGAGLLRPAPDPGVHRVSSRRETGLPTMRSCPSKLSLRRQRRPRLSPEPRARVTDRPSLDGSFTARLASSPFAPCTVKTVSHPTSVAPHR
jgi:hypothetical protein